MASWVPSGGSVIYDGQCGVCTRIVRLLQALDWFGRLQFYANNDPSTFDRFSGLDLERSRSEILVLDSKYGWYGGFSACEWIACRIPLLWILIPLTLIPGMSFIGNRCYKWVANRRHKISKLLGLESCVTPPR